jgi:hypothetical protein
MLTFASNTSAQVVDFKLDAFQPDTAALAAMSGKWQGVVKDKQLIDESRRGSVDGWIASNAPTLSASDLKTTL